MDDHFAKNHESDHMVSTLTDRLPDRTAARVSKQKSEPAPSIDHSARDVMKPTPTMPLLSGQGSIITSYTFDLEHGLVCEGESEELAAHGITDTMMYRTKILTTWEAFQIKYTVVWMNSDLWKMMGRLTGVAMVVALITVILVPNPAALKVAKFTQVSKFLNVVVGLLLGFFLSSSMNRWYNCVNGFLELLDAIRNLQMQFVALGVPEEHSVLCLRYGLTSAWLLYGQLLLEARKLTCEESTHSQRDAMWAQLCNKKALVDRTGKTMLLNEKEEDVLRMTRDPPGMMWMWVAAFIGRLAQDGWIPPMASPTYGRIMNICQGAHGGIRQVRASISVQAPLTYTHMLATLVHINNLLNAFTFGIVSGVATGTWLIRHQRGLYAADHVSHASRQEVAQDWQNMAVTFLYCFLGPLIYQSLLLIGMNLAQPFDSADAKMPIDRLLHQLEIDMCNGRDLVDQMSFEKPAFKQVPKPEPAKPPAT